MLGGNGTGTCASVPPLNFRRLPPGIFCLTPSGSIRFTPLRALLPATRTDASDIADSAVGAVAVRKPLRSVPQIESGGDRRESKETRQ